MATSRRAGPAPSDAPHEPRLARIAALVADPSRARMLAVLLGTGFMIAAPVLFIPAVVIFLIGTEIRVRTEDTLLASHFGDRFQAYRQEVPAYIPLVR